MEQINEMGERVIIEVEEERVAEQRCYFDYVHWEDYRENPAKRPEDVSWKARRHLWTRDQLKDKGFSNVEDIPLNWSPDSDEENYEAEEVFKRAEIWEIWDRVKYKRYYVARNYDKILREDDDP